MKNVLPTHLSNRALELTVLRLARRERQATVELMTHLAEFDRRRLYREAGYSSLYVYCTDLLKLSNDEAYNRMKAARTIRKFPQTLDLLAEGSLNLTTVRLIAPHLTPENHDEVLRAACGTSKREVEELVARLAPKPDVPASIRALPPPPAQPALPPVTTGLAGVPACAATPSADPVPAVMSTPSAAAVLAGLAAPSSPPARYQRPITPLSPERYQITFTAGAETRDKLEHARDLLRHAVPNGDIAVIMDRALTVLIESLLKKKFAMADRPRRSEPAKEGSRYVPAADNRAVYTRDGGRCQFVSESGHRCNERGFPEKDHVTPSAAGGPSTASNLRILCRCHNQFEAEKRFGPRSPEGEVREATVPYGNSIVNNTRSGTGCVPETQLVPRRVHRHGKVRSVPYETRCP
jgi:hypothetical protein